MRLKSEDQDPHDIERPLLSGNEAEGQGAEHRAGRPTLERHSAASKAQQDAVMGATLVLREEASKADDVREIEVEVLTEAVAEAVADAVGEAVHEAVAEAVQHAIEESGMHFDLQANIWTLVAVTGVVWYWRGVWNTFDILFGSSLYSQLGSLALGLAIMMLVRLTNVPLATSLPGG